MVTLTHDQLQKLRRDIYSVLQLHAHNDNNIILPAIDDIMEIIDEVLKGS
jgi:hypothetical protein